MEFMMANDNGNMKTDHIKGDCIEVYSTLGCKYCRMAKAKLDSIGVKYVSIDITDEPIDEEVSSAWQVGRRGHARANTVPQIYIGDTYIGGCDSLLKEVDSGKFFGRLIELGIDFDPEGPSTRTKEADSSSRTLESTLEGFIPLRVKPEGVVPKEVEGKEEEVLKSNFDGILNSLSFNPEPVSVNPDPLELSRALQKQALVLTDTYASVDGSRVDYQAMRKSSEFSSYVTLSTLLQSCTLESISTLPTPIRMSFFVNLYNAMIVHANCVLGPPEDSPAGRAVFFSGKSGAVYVIGGAKFSPDDIEHGVLRGNNPHPSQPPIASSYLLPWDERAILAIPYLDPRVHFVLNCGAASCPPIKILGDDPEPALATAAAAYLEGEIRLNNDKVYLPRLVLWYAKDFGLDLQSRVGRLLGMSKHGGESYKALKSLLDNFEGADKVLSASMKDSTLERMSELALEKENMFATVIEYNVYNWALNDVKK